MNREEALKWCVDNLDEWPAAWGSTIGGSEVIGWFWDVEPDQFGDLEAIFSKPGGSGAVEVIRKRDWSTSKPAKKPVGKRYHKFTAVSGSSIYIDFEKACSIVRIDRGKFTVVEVELVSGTSVILSTRDTGETYRLFTQETINEFIEAWEAYTG